MKLSEVQQRALREIAVQDDRGITCSNLGSALATMSYRRLPQTYARQGGRTLRALERLGLATVSHDDVHWNWTLTSRGLDELARSSIVEGVFEAMVNLPEPWRCSGRCGRERLETANHLLDEGWRFTSVGFINWGSCSNCRGDAHPHMTEVASRLNSRS